MTWTFYVVNIDYNHGPIIDVITYLLKRTLSTNYVEIILNLFDVGASS